jgi:hypothetical protein
LSEAKKYGARVALFGRKINNAENQLAFIRFLRLIADGEISAEEAVRAYHAVLEKLGIKPLRSLEEDMKLQTNVMSYDASGTTISIPSTGRRRVSTPGPVKEVHSPAETEAMLNGDPDFAKMTPAQKVAYHKARWDRILG